MLDRTKNSIHYSEEITIIIHFINAETNTLHFYSDFLRENVVKVYVINIQKDIRIICIEVYFM